MRIGHGAWVAGWTSLTVLLAFFASLVGPGQIDSSGDVVAMIRIGGGPFTMGAEADGSDARPVHTVELRAFDIDQVPVVNAQFAAFLSERGGIDGPRGLLYDVNDPAGKIVRVGSHFSAAQGFEQHPVTGETWLGARSFCIARGARLPSEAEWERAARGTNGRAYPWGNAPPDASRARFAYALLDFRAVGSYPAGATPEGVLDMAGNVRQWTSSRYLPYPYRAEDGREDPDADGERVTRGGGSSSTAEMIRSTYRNVGMRDALPSARPPVTFRCVRDAAEAE